MHTRYQDESQLFYALFFHKKMFFGKKKFQNSNIYKNI
jgi:hypothetical protein